MSTNLHRGLAPISTAAWKNLEDEVRRTFARNVAGRRVVDMPEPQGPDFSALTTGRYTSAEGQHDDGVRTRVRQNIPVLELRADFTLSREEVDSVLRGSADPDWQPAKDAATAIARAEDRVLFEGRKGEGIDGIMPSSSNPPVVMPADIREFPNAVAQATSALRLVGVDGPYVLFLPAAIYTEIAETVDHGYPIRDHIQRLLRDGQIIWAPALPRPVLISDRGGDYELHLGEDLAIGYQHHDDSSIQLYLRETLTVRVATAEASVVIGD